MPSDDLIPIDSDSEPSEPLPESIEPVPLEEVLPSSPTPVRRRAAYAPEDEDIRFEEDMLTPSTPRVETPPPASERASDPGGEISPDDLVTVDFAPSVPRVAVMAVSVPPERPRVSVPPAETRAAPLQPPAPIRPPLVIVPPQLGNIAQPSEASGARRKGKLWWEDLFNDDYLRTCERLSDDQLVAEVDFIEDRLSVERGGAVLDLGCG